jgi:hypothetical protein
MSRNTHFAIGTGILVLCAFWCLMGIAWFFGLGFGRDSVPGASVFDSSFMTFYILWGSGFLLFLWAAFRSFQTALRRPKRAVPPSAPSATAQQVAVATPDKKLARLLKK